MRVSLPPVSVPVYLATLSPRMLELTGEIADGWLGTSFVPEGAGAYFTHLDAGLARAGRSRADLDICQGAEINPVDEAGLARAVAGDTLAARLDNLARASSSSTPWGLHQPTTAYAGVMAAGPRRARVGDVHELAMAMPHVTVAYGSHGNPVYQVGGKSFVFFRTPRPDATDSATGERYPDVIIFWVPSESDKQALVQDHASPFFTTSHFDGHPSVLVRGSRIGELTRQELAELIQDAWLSQASPRRAAAWLSAQG
jgi:hypothetical protein